MLKKHLLKITITTICISCLILGCSKQSSNRIPFSELDFSVSYEDMVDKLGEPVSETETYLGKSYGYQSDYLSMDGQVRYTFDEAGKIASITWLYESEDGEEITGVYNDIHKQLENTYGKTEEATNNVTQLSDIWRLDTGNITLVALVSSDYNGIMYTYLTPEHSTAASN